MRIQVLGTGCPKCKKLEEMATEAAEELNLDYSIEKVFADKRNHRHGG
jgi:thiol-disulfide isomerase/thioredoxin